jgi:hypothetical protein
VGEHHPVDPDDVQPRLHGIVGGQLTTTLHGLRKIGLVTFAETSSSTSRGGHHQTIKRIEITDKGRTILNQHAPARVVPLNVLANDARASVDIPTYARKTELEEGAILDEFLKDASRPTAALPYGSRRARQLEAEAIEAAALPKPLDIVEDRTPEQLDADGDTGPVREMYARLAAETVTDEETHPEFPTPVLDALRNKQSKVAAAAALLEEAGMDDEAIRILDALHLSPTEVEYLAFAETFGR